MEEAVGSFSKPPIPLHVRGAGLQDRVLPSASAPARELSGPGCLVRDRLAIVRQCHDMSISSLSPRPATLSHFFFPKAKGRGRPPTPAGAHPFLEPSLSFIKARCGGATPHSRFLQLLHSTGEGKLRVQLPRRVSAHWREEKVGVRRQMTQTQTPVCPYPLRLSLPEAHLHSCTAGHWWTTRVQQRGAQHSLNNGFSCDHNSMITLLLST